jgi:hypothetical protein
VFQTDDEESEREEQALLRDQFEREEAIENEML